MKKIPRIRWENVAIVFMALGMEFFLFYLHVYREHIVKGDLFFEVMKNYGCFLGIALLVPSLSFFISEFVVSIKDYKTYKIKKAEERRAHIKKQENLAEEFENFYEEFFGKK